jgi:hypothetical protein
VHVGICTPGCPQTLEVSTYGVFAPLHAQRCLQTLEMCTFRVSENFGCLHIWGVCALRGAYKRGSLYLGSLHTQRSVQIHMVCALSVFGHSEVMYFGCLCFWEILHTQDICTLGCLYTWGLYIPKLPALLGASVQLGA